MLAKWLADNVPCFTVPLSRFGSWYGQATPFFIVVDNPSVYLIKHERNHVYQIWRGWLIGFAIRYVYYHLKYGYASNPFEVASRQYGRGESTDYIYK